MKKNISCSFEKEGINKQPNELKFNFNSFFKDTSIDKKSYPIIGYDASGKPIYDLPTPKLESFESKDQFVLSNSDENKDEYMVDDPLEILQAQEQRLSSLNLK